MAGTPNMVSRQNPKTLELNEGSNIKQVIGVMSGQRAASARSLVCGLLACDARRRGLKVGILDADVDRALGAPHVRPGRAARHDAGQAHRPGADKEPASRSCR